MFDKLTARDKHLLVFLAMFLIITGAFYFGAKPAMQDYKDNENRIMTLEDKKTLTEANLCMVDAMKADNDKLSKQIGEISDDYYKLLESEEIDKLLTDKAIAYGLVSRSLSITMPDKAVKTMPYELSKKYAAKIEKEKAKAGEDGGKTDENTDGTTEDTTASYVYCAKVNMTVEGSIESMNNLIDELSINSKSIEIMSANWSEKVLNLSLNIYMYDRK